MSYPTKLYKGLISGLIIMGFIILLCLFLFGCSQKVHHRPRYNHWAKPYKMYAPVKTHKPHVK